VTTAVAFLGGDRTASGSWRFGFGEHLLGAFGGVFGGAQAAAALLVARELAPDRVPVAVDCRFLRPLRAGDAGVRADLVHSGRRATIVTVDVSDGDDRCATRVTVSLVDLTTLHARDDERDARDAPSAGDRPWPHPPDRRVAIIDTLRPRGGRGRGGVVSTITVPWDDPAAAAEAVCMAGDLCVGPPVAAACGDRWVPHPNPDVSLRFAGQLAAAHELSSIGRVSGLVGGVASVSLEVWADTAPVAVGVATSLLLDP
jgi:hypothetical protein